MKIFSKENKFYVLDNLVRCILSQGLIEGWYIILYVTGTHNDKEYSLHYEKEQEALEDFNKILEICKN